MLTPAQTVKFASQLTNVLLQLDGVHWLPVIKQIEAAACAPLLERIAELEAKLTQRAPDGWHQHGAVVRVIGHGKDFRPDEHDNGEWRDEDGVCLEFADGYRDCFYVSSLLAAAPAAPEQQEQPPEECLTPRACSYEGACRGDCKPAAQAPNAQQATPSCASKTVDSDPQAALSARGSQQEQSELPPGWKTVVVPEEVGPEPDWEDVRYQAETATGIELPRAVFSIVIREVRRWLAAQQAEAQPVAMFSGRRLTPAGTREFFGYLLDGVDDLPDGCMLYTAPPWEVPLTLEQIDAAMAPLYNNRAAQSMGRIDDIATCRAVEAAHGIVAPEEKGGE